MNPLKDHKYISEELRQVKEFFNEEAATIRKSDLIIYILGFCVGLVFGYAVKMILS